jgi:hypothetical protein
MRRMILYGLRTIALLFVLAPRAHAPAPQNEEHVMIIHTMKATVLVSYGLDFRVTDVLRPQPGRDEVLVRIAVDGVNPPDTRTFDGAAAHDRHAPPAILGLGPIQRAVSKSGFNFNLEENKYVARSTCN